MPRSKTSQHKADARRTSAKSTRRRAVSTSRHSRWRHLLLRSFVLPLLVIVSVGAMGWYLYPLVRMQYVEQREVERLEQELEAIRERNEDLSAQVDRLRTPAGVEEAARQTLGLVKPGESVYLITGEEETSALMGVTSGSVPESGWRKLLDWVFGVES